MEPTTSATDLGPVFARRQGMLLSVEAAEAAAVQPARAARDLIDDAVGGRDPAHGRDRGQDGRRGRRGAQHPGAPPRPVAQVARRVVRRATEMTI